MTNFSTQAGTPKSSVLIPFGIALIAVGLILPVPATQFARTFSDSTVRSLVFILTDVFRLSFFAGILCVILGVVRNRSQKQKSPAKVAKV
ncbi:MAG: hypothetical protein JO053_02140 [Acidobacteria bacterium]|nr:hypothetical protein [Acidobacteriota bacterium]